MTCNTFHKSRDFAITFTFKTLSTPDILPVNLTLVIACVTHTDVFLVSDRRLISPTGNVFDDESNKAISICGTASFGYAGLAALPNKSGRRARGKDEIAGPYTTKNGKYISTGQWMQNRFSEHNVRTGFSASRVLEYEGNHLLRYLRYLHSQRHNYPEQKIAFLGAGWHYFKFRKLFGVYPCIWRISNSHKGRKDEAFGASEAVFYRVSSYLHKKHNVALTYVGVNLGRGVGEAVRSKASQLVSDGVSREDLAGYLLHVMKVAAELHPEVGESFLLSHIPKNAFLSNLNEPSSKGIFTNPRRKLDDKTSSFFYFGKDQDVTSVYGPRFVCDGFNVLYYHMRYGKGEALFPDNDMLPDME